MSTIIVHSAKGSTWKKHKYLKKIGDRYVYAKEKVKSKVKDITGLTAKEQAEQAFYDSEKARGYSVGVDSVIKNNRGQMTDALRSLRNTALKDYNTKTSNYESLYNKYKKTPLGRIGVKLKGNNAARKGFNLGTSAGRKAKENKSSYLKEYVPKKKKSKVRPLKEFFK